MLGNIGNIASLLRNAPELIRQAQEMQGRMKELQESLAKLRIEGIAGGGMVTVEANGQQKILAVHVEESLLDSRDKEMLEELLVAAVNQALDKARDAATEEMSRLAGEVDLSRFGDLFAKFGQGEGNSDEG